MEKKYVNYLLSKALRHISWNLQYKKFSEWRLLFITWGNFKGRTFLFEVSCTKIHFRA